MLDPLCRHFTELCRDFDGGYRFAGGRLFGESKTGPLPPWAKDGFSGDGSSYRHVEGLQGAVVGVVFGYPLSSPPRASRENKILWVSRNPPSGRLVIDAQRDGTGPVVSREVGFGGGQSIIDLPAPGCWRMTLRWDGQMTDTVDLPYEPTR